MHFESFLFVELVTIQRLANVRNCIIEMVLPALNPKPTMGWESADQKSPTAP